MRLAYPNVLKRIAVLLLTIVMLSSSLTIDVGTAQAQGNATDHISLIGFDVNAERLTSNQWIYYVNPSGYATICEYQGKTISKLIVPTSLDGIPVSAIDAGAFAALMSLKEITIPGNVTYIGDDIFGNNKTVRVAAYHGAKALQYARSHGLAIRDLSTGEKLRDNVISFADVSPDYYNVSGSTVIMRPVEAARVQVGDIIILHTPNPSSYQVESLSNVGGMVYVGVSSVSVYQALEEIEINNRTFYGGIAQITCEPGVYIADEGEAQSSSLVELKKNNKFSKSFTIQLEGDFKSPFTNTGGKRGPVLGGYFTVSQVFEWDIDIKISLFKGVERFKFDVWSDYTTDLKAEVKYAWTLPLFAVELFPITGGLIIDNKPSDGTALTFNVDFNCGISGSLSYSTKDRKGISIRKENNYVPKSLTSANPQSTVVGKISGSVSLEVKVKLYFIYVDILQLGIKPTLIAEASSDCATGCVDISVYFKFSVFAKVKLELWKHEFFNKTWELTLIKKALLFNHHREIPNYCHDPLTPITKSVKVAKCTRGDPYRIEFIDSQTGNQISPAINAWYGQTYSLPQPTKDGYQFYGWFSDRGCTTLVKDFLATQSMKLYAGFVKDGDTIPDLSKFPTYSDWQSGGSYSDEWYGPDWGEPVQSRVPVAHIGVTMDHYTLALGEKASVTATIKPDNADDASLTWSSDNTNVATVNDGVITAVSPGQAFITATSVSDPEVSSSLLVVVVKPVKSISISVANATLYVGEGGLSLAPQVSPTDATCSYINWHCSDESIVGYSGGKLFGLKPGTATVTLSSVSNPDVKTTCAITVIQKTRALSLNAMSEEMVVGDTFKLNANVYPTSSSNTNVVYSSNDPTVATVASNGKITALAPGQAVITANAADGFGASASCTINVHKQLELEKSLHDVTCYMQGSASMVIGYCSPTLSAIERTLEREDTLEWNLTRTSGNGVSEIDLTETSMYYDLPNASGLLPVVMLNLAGITGTGTDTYSLTCTSGNYSDSIVFKVNVKNEEQLASSAVYAQTTFRLHEGDSVTIPDVPSATKGKGVIPTGGTTTFDGDTLFDAKAMLIGDGSNTIRFDESGLYTANAVYEVDNLVYRIPLTFYVMDEQGLVHLPVAAVNLGYQKTSLVVGESMKITPVIEPSDAYNPMLTWHSSNEDVATVNNSGNVTTLSDGGVYIWCETTDGSEIQSGVSLTVENVLQLNDRTEGNSTVYLNGNTYATLDQRRLTEKSVERIINLGLQPVWSVEHISGDDSVSVAFDEIIENYNGVDYASGGSLQTVRVNKVGSDVFTVKCTAGDYSISYRVHVYVEQPAKELPNSLRLVNDAVSGVIDEPILLSTNFTCLPNSSALPSSYERVLTAGSGFWDHVKYFNWMDDAYQITFDEAGTYYADIQFKGSNFVFVAPVTITVKDENGDVHVLPRSISLNCDELHMLKGETVTLSATITPSNASTSSLVWVSADPGIVTVDGNKVTATGAGITMVSVYSKLNSSAIDSVVVRVEDAMTFDAEEDELKYTVFLDGQTRKTLDTVYLTAHSSQRVMDPTHLSWSLDRVSGDNLTLRGEPVTLKMDGQEVYGYRVNLHSVSRLGISIYDLTCTDGSTTANVQLTVQAIERDGVLPAQLSLEESEYDGRIGSLISFKPQVLCWPQDTRIPDGARVEITGDDDFTAAMNAKDYHTSRSLCTLSFNEAGRYDADLTYTYSNVVYRIPIRFNIRDANGSLPIALRELSLNRRDACLLKGETLQLTTVMTPADASKPGCSWTSTNPSVAKVSNSGLVTAVANGSARITCTPEDEACNIAYCDVIIEDKMTVAQSGAVAEVYLQGDSTVVLNEYSISAGTMERLEAAKLSPEWTVEKVSGTATEVDKQVIDDGKVLIVRAASLNVAGTDVYRVSCNAGSEYAWSSEFRLNVLDLGKNPPESITLRDAVRNGNVGETMNIDFSAVCEPVGTTLPNGMETTYIGIGNFYDNLDMTVFSTRGNTATVAFDKPGTYVLTKLYTLRNLRYVATCTINIGGGSSFDILNDGLDEVSVYVGGQSARFEVAKVADATMTELYDDVSWSLEKVSGNCTTTALMSSGGSAALYIANVKREGTEVWDLTCRVGEFTQIKRIVIHAITPRATVPTSIEIREKQWNGVIGNWIQIPLGVNCKPSGSLLPDEADVFWSLKFNGAGDLYGQSEIQNGILNVRFSESGYYSGILDYTSGNVHFQVLLYFNIKDEEGITAEPETLSLSINPGTQIVYPEGDINVPIAFIELYDLYGGVATSYAASHELNWILEIQSGVACGLAIEEVEPGIAAVKLKSISGTGSVSYQVKCKIGNDVYTVASNVKVAGNKDPRPNAVLKCASYDVAIGETVRIDHTIYNGNTNSVLATVGGCQWDNGALEAAIGYKYEDSGDMWEFTVYEEGKFTTTVSGFSGNLRFTIPLEIWAANGESDLDAITLKLPANLSEIGVEAFTGVPAQIVDLRGTKVRKIGVAAFKDCTELKRVYIPSTVTSIASEAFANCGQLTIYCARGSAAEAYANSNGISIVYLN